MKCIDAVEGTVKGILQQWYALCVECKLEDSEYVRNAKAVIDATRVFLSNNPELMENPQLLIDVLYTHARQLWLMGNQPAEPDVTAPADGSNVDQQEYQTYYYDYLYQRGIYPR